jgi:hypothetical protein
VNVNVSESRKECGFFCFEEVQWWERRRSCCLVIHRGWKSPEGPKIQSME